MAVQSINGRDDHVAWQRYGDGVARVRISTTVDQELLDDARKRHAPSSDAELIDQALAALIARDRAVEIDEAYAAAYELHPVDEPDERGDLASFRNAVST
jgi:hypothetical protein